MKKLYLKLTTLLGLVVSLTGYNQAFANFHSLAKSKLSITRDGDSTIIGFNQNWSYLPPLNSPELVNNIKKLDPQMIRFPGGTIAHSWDWRAGKTTEKQKISQEHQIGDLKILSEALNAKVMIVLDIVHSTLANQMEMLDSLKSIGIPINFVELGNELYSKSPDLNYAAIFSDGTAYAEEASKWITAVKASYPHAKIASLLIGKTGGTDDRMNTWNIKVTNYMYLHNIPVDAYTYHFYIPSTGNFEERISDFNLVKVPTPGKELWITEYGNMMPFDNPNYLPELTKMIDWVQANFDIALSHTIIGNQTTHAKLEPSTKGRTLTAEGEMFVKRVKAK